MIKIEVTQDHINYGEPQDRHCSPLALALIYAGFMPVVVEDDHFVFDGEPFALPANAIEWQDKHDVGDPVEPFIFFVQPGFCQRHHTRKDDDNVCALCNAEPEYEHDCA